MMKIKVGDEVLVIAGRDKSLIITQALSSNLI